MDRSTSAAGTQLDELHRAEVLTHTRYPRLGRWYPPTMGAVGAGWVASYTLPRALQIPAMVLFAIGIGVVARMYINKRGVQPSFRRTPRRLKYEMVGFGLSAWTLFGLLALVWQVSTWWMTALVAFVGMTLLTATYEHRYANAAQRVEHAAGIVDQGS